MNEYPADLIEISVRAGDGRPIRTVVSEAMVNDAPAIAAYVQNMLRRSRDGDR